MKKNLNELKAALPEIDPKTQAATKGGDGYYGLDYYSSPGAAFDNSGGYVQISYQINNYTTTTGQPETQYITLYSYWDGTEVLSDKVEWIDEAMMPDGTFLERDFGSHDEDMINSLYNKPWYEISVDNTQSSTDPNQSNGYFDDLNITTDPYAYGSDGYNSFGLDPNGFDRDGINSDTGTPYDSSGFDQNGLSPDGYNQQQYADAGGYINGFDPLGLSADGIPEQLYIDGNGYYGGYNQFGLDPDGFGRDGINSITGTTFDIDGFNQSGFDARDFDRDGINSITGTYYDTSGYDQAGLSSTGHTAQEYADNGGYIDGFNQFNLSAAGYSPLDYANNGGYIDGQDEFGNTEGENIINNLEAALDAAIAAVVDDSEGEDSINIDDLLSQDYQNEQNDDQINTSDTTQAGSSSSDTTQTGSSSSDTTQTSSSSSDTIQPLTRVLSNITEYSYDGGITWGLKEVDIKDLYVKTSVDEDGNKIYSYDGGKTWTDTLLSQVYTDNDAINAQIVAARDATYNSPMQLSNVKPIQNAAAPNINDVMPDILKDFATDVIIDEVGSAIHLSTTAKNWLSGLNSASNDGDNGDLAAMGYDLGKAATGVELSSVEAMYKILNTKQGIDWQAQAVATSAIEDLYRVNNLGHQQKDIDAYLKDYQMLLNLYKAKTGHDYYQDYPQPTIIKAGE